MNQTLNRNDLVEKMNLGGVPAEVQDQIIAQYGENVLKAVTLEVITLLSDEDRVVFEELTQSGNETKMEKFLAEKIKNLDVLIKEKSDNQIEKVRKAMSA
ncbi:MAG: hypothetical protein V4664_01840 [Patescibacteria group bacterium]